MPGPWAEPWGFRDYGPGRVVVCGQAGHARAGFAEGGASARLPGFVEREAEGSAALRDGQPRKQGNRVEAEHYGANREIPYLDAALQIRRRKPDGAGAAGGGVFAADESGRERARPRKARAEIAGFRFRVDANRNHSSNRQQDTQRALLRKSAHGLTADPFESKPSSCEAPESDEIPAWWFFLVRQFPRFLSAENFR